VDTAGFSEDWTMTLSPSVTSSIEAVFTKVYIKTEGKGQVKFTRLLSKLLLFNHQNSIAAVGSSLYNIVSVFLLNV